MATLVKTTGERSEFNPANGRYFSLKELQSVVGGDAEVVYLRNATHPIMIVNESAYGLGLPFNQTGTDLYRHAPIVGDILLCKQGEII